MYGVYVAEGVELEEQSDDSRRRHEATFQMEQLRGRRTPRSPGDARLQSERSAHWKGPSGSADRAVKIGCSQNPELREEFLLMTQRIGSFARRKCPCRDSVWAQPNPTPARRSSGVTAGCLPLAGREAGHRETTPSRRRKATRRNMKCEGKSLEPVKINWKSQ